MLQTQKLHHSKPSINWWKVLILGKVNQSEMVLKLFVKIIVLFNFVALFSQALMTRIFDTSDT